MNVEGEREDEREIVLENEITVSYNYDLGIYIAITSWLQC
jgi:hypothetical protein